MDKREFKYDLQGVMTLGHLADTVLTVSEMSGGGINGKQYFVNTGYRLPEDKRNGKDDVGLRRTGGFSIAAEDMPKLAALLNNLTADGPKKHYFVCPACTSDSPRIVLHEKQSADAPDACPRKEPQAQGNDAFVVR